MRIQGNQWPEAVHVEAYAPQVGMAEVRLRDNVRALSDAMHEYDEYVLHVPAREGLEEEIRANLEAWLATGRTLESNPMTTVMRENEEALATCEAALNELGVQTRE
jgi:hypothetical protein